MSEEIGEACSPSARDAPVAVSELPAQNSPAIWDRILAGLPSSAIIAGGAVRDYLLGVPPKDIDVFLDVREWPKNGMAGFRSLGGDRDEEYAAMSTIAIVQRGTVEGFQVDVVGVFQDLDAPLTPADIIATFDLGITRCWYAGGEVHDTPEARADREGRCVALLLHDRPAKSRIRFDRFNARHGGAFTYFDGATTDTATGAERRAEPILAASHSLLDPNGETK